MTDKWKKRIICVVNEKGEVLESVLSNDPFNEETAKGKLAEKYAKVNHAGTWYIRVYEEVWEFPF